jgi:hypothetical protein
VQKQAVEGNDPHGDHGQVYEGERGAPNCCVLGGCLFSFCVEEVSKICLMLGHLLCSCCVVAFQVQ